MTFDPVVETWADAASGKWHTRVVGLLPHGVTRRRATVLARDAIADRIRAENPSRLGDPVVILRDAGHEPDIGAGAYYFDEV